MKVVPPPWAQSNQPRNPFGLPNSPFGNEGDVGMARTSLSGRVEKPYEVQKREERYKREEEAREAIRKTGRSIHANEQIEQYVELERVLRDPRKTLGERFLPGGNSAYKYRIENDKRRASHLKEDLAKTFQNPDLVIGEWKNAEPIRKDREKDWAERVKKGIEEDRRKTKNTRNMIGLLKSKDEIRTSPNSETAAVMGALDYLYSLDQRFPGLMRGSVQSTTEQNKAYQEAMRIRSELGQRFGDTIFQGEYKSNLTQVTDAYQQYRERLKGTDPESQDQATKEVVGILKSKKAIILNEYRPMGVALKMLERLDYLAITPLYGVGNDMTAEQRDLEVNRLRNALWATFGYGNMEKITAAYQDYKYRTTSRT